MAGGKPWTPRDDADLAALLAAGTKYATIAKRLGRTYSAVAQRAFGLAGRDRLPRLHKPGELTAWVKRLVIPGVSDSDAAGVLGVTRQTVALTRWRIGRPSGSEQGGHRKLDPATWSGISTKAKFLRLYSGVGRSDAEIARLLGLTKPYVREIRVGFGLPALGVARREERA